MSQNNHSANESFLNIQPSPSALVQALRDIGYSMESAVADVIDNSITADANLIHIKFAWNDAQPWFAIIDDGNGMTGAEMTNAMRLGNRNPLEERDEKDLGRFGLGMKTASFSQCCKLTLISKKEGSLACREWDLDHSRQAKAFSCLTLQPIFHSLQKLTKLQTPLANNSSPFSFPTHVSCC